MSNAAGQDKSAGKNKKTRKRSRYQDWQWELVKREYETRFTPEEKQDLCRRAQLNDIHRLYNMAYKLGITRHSEDLSDAEFRAFTNGDKEVINQRRSYTDDDEMAVLTQRDDPRKRKFTDEDDRFLIANYGRMSVVTIAMRRGLSETAVMYRARQLTRPSYVDSDGVEQMEAPLRYPAVGFSLKRVAIWLGLTEDEIKDKLPAAGVVVRPLPNRKGHVEDHWVLSKSLAPFLREHGAKLIKERDADRFFIKEIIETEHQLAKGETERAGCYFVDHGHKCNNPWAGPRYQTYCPNGIDAKCKVKELRF